MQQVQGIRAVPFPSASPFPHPTSLPSYLPSILFIALSGIVVVVVVAKNRSNAHCILAAFAVAIELAS